MRRRGWLPALLLTIGIVLAVGAVSAPFLLASPAVAEPAAAPVTQARELIILPVLLALLVAGMVLGREADSET